MDESASKELRLKKFMKQQMRASLLAIGRKLVTEKGPEFLTARKLSEASKVSVGTIYNLFATMEAFVQAENMQTLDELFAEMKIILPEANPFVNINRYVDVFSGFVINHPRLWQLLFREHLNESGNGLPLAYLRKIRRIENLFDREISQMFGQLAKAEKRLAGQVLEMSLFALSGFVAGKGWEKLRQVNKENVCKLLLNTYLAGLASLKR